MNRRNLLRSTALIPIVMTFAGCATSTNPVAVVSVVAQDANLIAAGLATAIASLQALPSLTAAQQATLTQLDGYLATIQADAKTIAAATATPATSVVSEIVQLVQTFAPIALSFIPGGGLIVPIINAALSLAPQLLADIGVTGAAQNAVVPRVVGVAMVNYSPDAARLILRGAVAK